MNNFVYETPTKVYFGKDEELKVGKLVAEYRPNKVLLHYGGKSAKQSGLLDRVKRCLEEAGVRYVELGGVVPNPELSLVREGIALCRKEAVDFVLAVGGGGSSFHKSSLNGKDITKYTSLSNLGLDIASVTYTPYHLNGLTNNVIYNTTESRIISKYPFIEYYTVTHYNYKNDPESEKYSVYNVTKSDSNVAGGFVIVKYLGQA